MNGIHGTPRRGVLRLLCALCLLCGLSLPAVAQQSRIRFALDEYGASLGRQTYGHYYLLLNNREAAWYTVADFYRDRRVPDNAGSASSIFRDIGVSAGFLQTLFGDRRYRPYAVDLELSGAVRERREEGGERQAFEAFPVAALRLTVARDRSLWSTSRASLEATSGTRVSVPYETLHEVSAAETVHYLGANAHARRHLLSNRLMISVEGRVEQSFGKNTAGAHDYLLSFADEFRGPDVPYADTAVAFARAAVISRLLRGEYYSRLALDVEGFAEIAATGHDLPALRSVLYGESAEGARSSAFGGALTLRMRHEPVSLDGAVRVGVAVDFDEPSARRWFIEVRSRPPGD